MGTGYIAITAPWFLLVNFIWQCSLSILHNDTGDLHPIPVLPNWFAMDLQYILDKNFIAKSVTPKLVFSSISARSFFFACSWLIVARMWAFQRLMHVIDQLISYFNSSLFGKICLCLVTKVITLDNASKDCHTGDKNFYDYFHFLCWIWQSVLDTVVSYTFTTFYVAMSKKIPFQVSRANYQIFH